jgi:hypothetical protein
MNLDLYAVIGARPDLTYTVTMLSQFSYYSTKAHLVLVYRVLRNLKDTLDWSLFYANRHPLHSSALVMQAMPLTSTIAAHLPTTALC